MEDSPRNMLGYAPRVDEEVLSMRVLTTQTGFVMIAVSVPDTADAER